MAFKIMAYKSIDEPCLLEDILEQLTVIAEDFVARIASHPATGAAFYAGDMGFNNGTLLSPDFMGKVIVPRQKLNADACHEHGKPFLLHSCGKIDSGNRIASQRDYQNEPPVSHIFKGSTKFI